MDAGLPIVVLGARRSGTNYVEALLDYNTKHKVLNLNKSAADNSGWTQRGSKHDMDIPIHDKIRDCIPVVVIKNPLSWLISRLRYEDDCCRLNPDHNRKQTEDIIENEWNRFYTTLSVLSKPTHWVRYEDVVQTPEKVIRGLSEKAGIWMKDGWNDVQWKIGPNRSIQEAHFTKPEDPFTMYHDQYPNERVKKHWWSRFSPTIMELEGYK